MDIKILSCSKGDWVSDSVIRGDVKKAVFMKKRNSPFV